MVAAPEEHPRARDVEGRRDDDDALPAVRAREPGDRLAPRPACCTASAAKQRTWNRGRLRPAAAEVARLRPLAACVGLEIASTGATPRADERERRVEAPVEAAREDDHGVGVGGRRVGRAARRRGRRRRRARAPTRTATTRRRRRISGVQTVPSPPVSGVLFTCAGQRVDIVTAFKRAGARTLATDVNPLAPALYHADEHAFVPRVDDPGYVAALRDARRTRTTSRSIVPLTDLDHGVLSRARATSSARSCSCRRRRSSTRSRTSGSRTCSSRSAASARRRRGCRTTLPDDVEFPVLVKARHGFGSRGIYRCADRARARVLPRLHDATTRWCRRAAAARSSRSTSSAISRPLPQRRAAHDDRVEGRRVDQGDDDPRRGADRGRPPRLRDARARRAGEHPVLPRAGRHAPRHRHQPALRRRLPAADGRREPLPGARARARGGRAARAAARRLPRRARDDALLLGARAVGRGRRYLGAVRGRAPRAGRTEP